MNLHTLCNGLYFVDGHWSRMRSLTLSTTMLLVDVYLATDILYNIQVLRTVYLV